MGVRGDLYCLCRAALGAESRVEKAGATRIVCDRVGWDAWGTLVGSGGLFAVCTAGWEYVSAAEHDYLSRILFDCGHSGVAGSDAAMADSKPWAFVRRRHKR